MHMVAYDNMLLIQFSSSWACALSFGSNTVILQNNNFANMMFCIGIA